VIIWERELQVKVKKIKPHRTKHVGDAGIIHIIDVKGIARVVVLVERRNCDNPAGEIDTDHLMEIKVSIVN
jgi:hypothetical protein